MLPRIQAISRLSVDQNVSMAALSQQSQVEPKLTWSPATVAMEQKVTGDVSAALVGVVHEPVGVRLALSEGHDQGVDVRDLCHRGLVG